jgi:hypothetical protein
MNLQDALAYRSDCLIHKQTLRPTCIAPQACGVEDHVNGIRIAIKEMQRRREQVHYLTLNYDGIWQQETGTDIMSLLTTSIGTGVGPSLRLMMVCPDCFDCDTGKGAYAGRLLNPVTPAVKDIHRHTHNYCIMVRGLPDSKFECEVDSEVFHYTKNNKFYQVIADPKNGSARFMMGTCDPDGKFFQLEDNSMHLDAPHFDFTRVKELDKLLEKIQIYNLFS